MGKDKPARLRYPLETQVAELQRELDMRRRVYPRFVAARKITQDQAHERIAILSCTLAMMEWLLEDEQTHLFAP